MGYALLSFTIQISKCVSPTPTHSTGLTNSNQRKLGRLSVGWVGTCYNNWVDHLTQFTCPKPFEPWPNSCFVEPHRRSKLINQYKDLVKLQSTHKTLGLIRQYPCNLNFEIMKLLNIEKYKIDLFCLNFLLTPTIRVFLKVQNFLILN